MGIGPESEGTVKTEFFRPNTSGCQDCCVGMALADGIGLALAHAVCYHG